MSRSAPRHGRLRSMLGNAALVLLSLALLAIVLEVALRFAPVNDGFNFIPVNADQPVFRAAPDQDVTWSKDWDFYGARRIHINDAGFRNDQDYAPQGGGPLVAVVGDSYVEAVQVDYDETFFGRLARHLQGRARVYSFGFSGAPLSQYLVWARFAGETYDIDHLVVGVIGNDFDESLAWYKRGQGFHHYAACRDGTHCLERVDFRPSFFGAMVKRSALARYLVYNLGILSLPARLSATWDALIRDGATPAYVGNVAAEVDAKRLADSRLAVDLFLEDIPGHAGLPPTRITFVVDGRLYEQPDVEFDRSYFGQMRAYFIARARALGFHVIDMRPVFSASYRRDRLMFQSERDGHWNALGHRLVAEQLETHFDALLR